MRCGTRSGRSMDKFAECGLTALPATVVKAPLVGECLANLECKVANRMTAGDHTIFVGEIVALQRKNFRNIMEELVLAEVAARLEADRSLLSRHLDVGDLAAYALNRLPALYATCEEGAEHQRARALEELSELIAQRVTEGLAQTVDRPHPHPEARRLEGPWGTEMIPNLAELLERHSEGVEARD